MKNQRKSKKGKSDAPTETGTRKSSQPMKQNSKITKQFLTYTVVGIISLFVVTAIFSLIVNSPSTQNLAMVVPPNTIGNSMAGLMMQQPSKPIVAPPRPQQPQQTLSHLANNAGQLFVQARSTEETKHEQQIGKKGTKGDNDLISFNADGDGITRSSDSSPRREINIPPQFYYYFDSTSQAFHLHDTYTTFPDKRTSTHGANFQRSLGLSGKYQPTLCSDGQTYGFSDLATLRNAIGEISDAYSDAVSRWQHYKAALSEYEGIKNQFDKFTVSQNNNKAPFDTPVIEKPPSLPEHMLAILEIAPEPYVICPHTTLRASLGGRHSPIHINAEDITVQCDSCIINTPGTHFSFGALAKNVLIKGLTLMGATESSVVFRENGADVSFEECYWVDNESVGMQGAVADMNSTSSIQFFRCEISDLKQKITRPGMHGVPNTVTSSLTLRG